MDLLENRRLEGADPIQLVAPKTGDVGRNNLGYMGAWRQVFDRQEAQ